MCTRCQASPSYRWSGICWRQNRFSLARTGVVEFCLVDENIFLPENICRHVLDWRNVGEHKVDALAEMLSFVAADIEVEVCHLNLTGQESTASLSGVLDRLGRCNLVVDATAVPQVFNLLAAVATTYERPLVWVEVYAGGIGGLVARSRPGLDPDPFTMRQHITTSRLGLQPRTCLWFRTTLQRT